MYLPYVGLFNKIKSSDIFVIGDEAQFSKGYFYNRNKIKTPNGELMLTVPLKKNGYNQKLNQVEISNEKPWNKKHLQSLNSFYRKADHFDDYIEFFEEVFNAKWETLFELNMKTILYIMEQLDIDIPVFYVSSLMRDYTFISKTQKIIDICKKLDADTYLSGIGGKNYIEPEIFVDNEIKLEYQNYVPKEYKQLYGEFIPNLSIIDLLFNLGDEAREIIK
jgi:hypothetical protein